MAVIFKLVTLHLHSFANMATFKMMFLFLRYQVELCRECIEWAKNENRTFLRQALEARLLALLFETKCYTEALQLGNKSVFVPLKTFWKGCPKHIGINFLLGLKKALQKLKSPDLPA